MDEGINLNLGCGIVRHNYDPKISDETRDELATSGIRNVDDDIVDATAACDGVLQLSYGTPSK